MAVTEGQLLRVEQPGGLVQQPVAGGETLYAGTIAFIKTDGYVAGAFSLNAIVAGVVAHRDVDNSGGSDGDETVELYTRGKYTFPYTGVAQANVGDLPHATDNFTLAASGGAVFGYLTRVVDTDLAECDIGRRTQ